MIFEKNNIFFWNYRKRKNCFPSKIMECAWKFEKNRGRFFSKLEHRIFVLSIFFLFLSCMCPMLSNKQRKCKRDKSNRSDSAEHSIKLNEGRGWYVENEGLFAENSIRFETFSFSGWRHSSSFTNEWRAVGRSYT